MGAAKLRSEILKGYTSSTPHELERLTLGNEIMEHMTTIHCLKKYLKIGLLHTRQRPWEIFFVACTAWPWKVDCMQILEKEKTKYCTMAINLYCDVLLWCLG